MKTQILFLLMLFFGVFVGAQTLENEKTYDLKGAGGYSTKEVASPTSKSGVKMSEAYPEEINNKNYPDMLDTFDYPSIEIKDLVQVMSKLTGKRFIMGDRVNGKVSIVSPGPISVATAYKAFLSALQMNDLTVVPKGKFLKIIKSRDAVKDSIETYSGDYFPNSDQMVTKILKVKHIPVKELDKALRALYSKDGDLKVYEPTNSIILSDYGSNVEKIIGILKEMDVPGFEEKMEVIKIRYARAKDIADLINKIINKGEKKSTSRFRRRNDDKKGKGAVSLSYVTADERTNSVIVLGNTLGVEKAKGLVATLDFRLEGDQEGGVHVYYVKHGSSEDIAKTLGGLADESRKASQSSRRFGGRSSSKSSSNIDTPKKPSQVFGNEVSIKADKNTNSLIITASPQDYKQVLSLLAKIDIPRDQVFVETVIMEISADNVRNVGLDVGHFTGVGGQGTVENPHTNVTARGMFGIGKGQGTFAEMLRDPVSALSGGILSFATGDKQEVIIGGVRTSIKSVMGLVRLLQQYKVGNVLSTPQLMALDNEEASLEVGDEISIGNTVFTSAAGSTQSPQRKEVKTVLEITPSISPESNSVRMKIKQTIQDVGNREAGDPDIKKKALTTNIVVPSGDTAVLGGMVNEKTSKSVRKVPLLGDIPILGWLFRSKSKSVVKSNLMLFITPKIIRNPIHSRNLVKKQLDKRLRFIKKNMGGVDPHGEKVDEISKVGPGHKNKNWDETPDGSKEYPAKDSL